MRPLVLLALALLGGAIGHAGYCLTFGRPFWPAWAVLVAAVGAAYLLRGEILGKRPRGKR